MNFFLDYYKVNRFNIFFMDKINQSLSFKYFSKKFIYLYLYLYLILKLFIDLIRS